MRRLCLGFAVTLLLPGCTDLAVDAALKDAQARCAGLGEQFVQDQVKKTEMVVVSSAQVSGHCVGPGEAGYVPPYGR